MSVTIASVSFMETPEDQEALKKRKAQWLRFNARHKDTTEIIEIDGEKKILWKCNCGIEKAFKANSGWVIGHKVTWRIHFEEVITRGKSK
jgi:lysyl-tRNA synthetase class I